MLVELLVAQPLLFAQGAYINVVVVFEDVRTVEGHVFTAINEAFVVWYLQMFQRLLHLPHFVHSSLPV